MPAFAYSAEPGCGATQVQMPGSKSSASPQGVVEMSEAQARLSAYQAGTYLTEACLHTNGPSAMQQVLRRPRAFELVPVIARHLLRLYESQDRDREPG